MTNSLQCPSCGGYHDRMYLCLKPEEEHLQEIKKKRIRKKRDILRCNDCGKFVSYSNFHCVDFVPDSPFSVESDTILCESCYIKEKKNES